MLEEEERTDKRLTRLAEDKANPDGDRLQQQMRA
jgi:hypothetical protein